MNFAEPFPTARASRRSRLGLAALALATFQACAVGPDYVTPQPEMPDAWHEALLSGFAAGEADLRTWWAALEDPELDGLITRASEGNLDLRQAVARIEESRARLGFARGEWFPDVDATGSAERDRLSEEAFTTVPGGRSRADNIFATGFDSLWEVDLWGRIRRSVESAGAGYQATIEAYRDVLVILYAEVALAYVEVRALQARIDYAERNVETQRGTLQLTVERNNAGLVGDLDVRQAEQNLASTESRIPQLRQGLAAAIHRLGVLLGQPPSALYAELAPQAPIPSPPAEIVVGLPTELLRQRPDIRAAERALAAQTARIGVATAELYPRLVLLGTFEFQALRGNDLLGAQSRAYSYGPSVRWNIFDAGRVRSAIRAEDALTDESLASYEQVVLRSLEEVENSLVGYAQETDRREALTRAVTASSEAVRLVDTLYRTGLTDFQNVLDTQRTLFELQDDLAQSEGLVVQNLVRLYKALGGGWDPSTPIAIPTPPTP